MRKLSNLLLLFGIAVLIFAAYQIYDYKIAVSKGLKDVEEFFNQNDIDISSGDDEKLRQAAAALKLSHGDAFAILKIPSIKLSLPILEGTDLPVLKKGVGHEPATGIPGEGRNIFLAGHNDSAFKDVGKIKKGDLLEIEMPYGTFQYTMTNTKIVNKSNTSVITDPHKAETLILSTCYPFYSIVSTPKRYIVYAKLKGFTPNNHHVKKSS